MEDQHVRVGLGGPVLQGCNENYIECTDNGSVKIYHDFLPKLETTSTGLQLTGNLLPEANNTRDIGASGTVFANVYATTFQGNVNAASGNSTFNNITVNGLLTGSISGNSGTATQLATARNIGGVSFNGTADIDLPGVNTSGNQNTSGVAAKATDININETSTNTNYQVTFSEAGAVTSQSGNHYRQYIDNDNAHFLYNPSTYTLSGLNNVTTGSITATTFGTATQNAYGTRTVSTGNPAGGSDGDIWYKY